MSSRLKKNHYLYLLCLGEEARPLYRISLDELVKSQSTNYMVYKSYNKNLMNTSDYDEWIEIIEIEETEYSILHLNLCFLIGRKVRRKKV